MRGAWLDLCCVSGELSAGSFRSPRSACGTGELLRALAWPTFSPVM